MKNYPYLILLFLAFRISVVVGDYSEVEAQEMFLKRFSDRITNKNTLETLDRISKTVFPERRLKYPENYVNAYLDYYGFLWDKDFQILPDSERKVIEEQISELVLASRSQILEVFRDADLDTTLFHILDDTSKKVVSQLYKEIDNPFSPFFKSPLSQSELDALKKRNAEIISDALTEEKTKYLQSISAKKTTSQGSFSVQGVDKFSINGMEVENLEVMNNENMKRISKKPSLQKTMILNFQFKRMLSSWVSDVSRKEDMIDIPDEVRKRMAFASEEYYDSLKKQSLIDAELRSKDKLKEVKRKMLVLKTKEATDAIVNDCIDIFNDDSLTFENNSIEVDSANLAEKSMTSLEDVRNQPRLLKSDLVEETVRPASYHERLGYYIALGILGVAILAILATKVILPASGLNKAKNEKEGKV